jgi:phosphate transport system protein
VHHFEERLERDLADLRDRVTAVGELLDRAVENAVRAFLTRDGALAADTILPDKPNNRATREIDRRCHLFVARHLPGAGHLRFISAVLRLSTALERIGDYAVSIAKGAVQMRSPSGPAVVDRDIEMMAEQARSMLRQSLTAFRDLSPDLARGTITMETQADALYRKVYRDLLAEGETGHIPLRDLFACLVTFNRLERITDQAKNICDETLFAATGRTKPRQRYRILFLDETNALAGPMAHAIAQKNFRELGEFTSAGWSPADAVEEGLAEFLDSRGHDSRGLKPRPFDPAFERLRPFHIIIALSPAARARIPELPFSTVFVDWSADVEEVRRGEGDEATRREALYRRLSQRLHDLMEILHGDVAG